MKKNKHLNLVILTTSAALFLVSCQEKEKKQCNPFDQFCPPAQSNTTSSGSGYMGHHGFTYYPYTIYSHSSPTPVITAPARPSVSAPTATAATMARGGFGASAHGAGS